MATLQDDSIGSHPVDEDETVGVSIGIAVGQRRSPTGICVVEQKLRGPRHQGQLHYYVRHSHRLPPSTRYPAIAERLCEILSHLDQHSGFPVSVYADVTGLGASVIELLREKAPVAVVTGCYFTYGDQLVEEERGVRMGKGHLVATLQTLLQSERLHLTRTPEVEIMARELCEFEICPVDDANDRYGAFAVGTQDDLVTALGLAVCQKDPRLSFYGTVYG